MSEQCDLAAQAAEATGAADAGLALNPLVGFGTADLVAGLWMGEHLIRHPLAMLNQQAGLVGFSLRAWVGETVIKPPRSERRFADPVWR